MLVAFKSDDFDEGEESYSLLINRILSISSRRLPNFLFACSQVLRSVTQGQLTHGAFQHAHRGALRWIYDEQSLIGLLSSGVPVSFRFSPSNGL